MTIPENLNIGCIGAGNMGAAIILGLASDIPAKNLMIYDIEKSRTDLLSEKYGIISSGSIQSLADNSDIIIIAVKPDTVAEVISKIKNTIKNKVIVSIAAGVTIDSIEKEAGKSCKIIRVMPNTPALTGEGMSVLSPNKNIDNTTLQKVEKIFSGIGRVLVLPEKMMNAVTGLSGSGPAYVFTFIQALTDGGVKMGIPRSKALILAAQTVMGAAKMVMETGEDPAALRSSVTSPGGTTIDGIHILERAGFSGIVIDAVEAASEKSRILGEK